MSGNVAEWVNDWYAQYSSASSTNPAGPATGSFKIYRNGSYNDPAKNIRCGYRYPRELDYKQPSIGFRIAM